MSGLLGRSREEVELTKKLAATLVQQEVIAPMEAIGWGHGTPPTPEILAKFAAQQQQNSPPASGQPAPQGGAPAGQPTPIPAPQSGQPAPAKPPGQQPAPAKTDVPAELAAAQNVLALFESLRDPATGLIMGKYKDVPAALQGAGHLANMAKGALGRAETAEQELQRLRSTPAQPVAAPPAAAPAAAPQSKPYAPVSRPEVEAARLAYDAVLLKVAEDGGVLNGDSAKTLAAAGRELARVEALAAAEDAQRKSEHDKSVVDDRHKATQEYMRTKYPDSMRYVDEVDLHLRLNPLLTVAFDALVSQGREQQAVELVWLDFDKSRSGSSVQSLSPAEAVQKEADLAAREQVRKELRDQALKDAGVVQGSAGGTGVHENAQGIGPTQDEIDNYAAGMRRNGDAPGSSDAARWRHAVIGRFLPPELFGG